MKKKVKVPTPVFEHNPYDNGPKYCKDCVWAKRGWLFGLVEPIKCVHPENIELDLTTGKNEPKFIYASTCRVCSSDCGSEGRRFVRKRK